MSKYIAKTIKVVSLLVLVAFICDICHERYKLNPYNQAPLNITTFDGSNSPYHPSVRYYENGWNGYKYWMAETPFYPYCKPYRDRNECPCIHVSNDGQHWTEIFQNPLDDLDSAGEKDLDYFSDPHLVQNGDTLECWYRINKRHGDEKDRKEVYLLCKKTTDGIHWSERDTLFDLSKIREKEIVSPAILHPDSTYDMWYVDNEKLFYLQSTNPKNWENAQVCELKGFEVTPWHIDVVEADGYYWLLCYDIIRNRLTLWKGKDKKEFAFVKVFLDPSLAIGSFYQNALYRSCMLKQSDDLYRVYFSAFNEEMTFLGLMEGPSLENMLVVDIDNAQYSDFLQFLKYYFLTRWRAVYFRYRHFNDK